MSNSSICVDAGLVIRLVANPADVSVHQLWERWAADPELCIAAPTLLFYEVSNALYQYHRLGLLSAAAVALAQEAALALPIDLFGTLALHLRAVDLAAKHALPAAYDAHYLALAEQLEAELWTADRRLFQAVGDALPWVHQV